MLSGSFVGCLHVMVVCVAADHDGRLVCVGLTLWHTYTHIPPRSPPRSRPGRRPLTWPPKLDRMEKIHPQSVAERAKIVGHFFDGW